MPSGELAISVVTFRDAINSALREEMLRDSSVFLFGEDIGRYGGAYAVTKGLLQEFGPERVIDAPISEAIIVGAATGAAMTGAHPVVEIMYVDFITLAMDQLVNQAAKIHYMFGGQAKVPMVVRTQQGIGRGGGAQHSQSLEAWLVHVPGLKVVAPSCPADAKGLLKAAIRDNNPVVFLEHKALYALKGEVPEGEWIIPIGEADVKRTGRDLSLIAYSAMVPSCLKVAELLQQQGVEIEVVDLRSLKPLDFETVKASVRKCRRAVVVHEACLTGGFGAEISACLSEELFGELVAPVRRVAGYDVPLPANSRLEREVVPSVERITAAVLKVMGR